MSRSKLPLVAALAAFVAAWPGIATADLNTALSVYRSGDHATAPKQQKPLVDSGVIGATNTLAGICAPRRGGPKDSTPAVSLHRIAPEAGNVDAEFNLATVYSSSNGASKSLDPAATWFRKAAVGQSHDLGRTKEWMRCD